jgi:hypothetical protein
MAPQTPLPLPTSLEQPVLLERVVPLPMIVQATQEKTTSGRTRLQQMVRRMTLLTTRRAIHRSKRMVKMLNRDIG